MDTETGNMGRRAQAFRALARSAALLGQHETAAVYAQLASVLGEAAGQAREKRVTTSRVRLSGAEKAEIRAGLAALELSRDVRLEDRLARLRERGVLRDEVPPQFISARAAGILLRMAAQNVGDPELAAELRWGGKRAMPVVPPACPVPAAAPREGVRGHTRGYAVGRLLDPCSPATRAARDGFRDDASVDALDLSAVREAAARRVARDPEPWVEMLAPPSVHVGKGRRLLRSRPDPRFALPGASRVTMHQRVRRYQREWNRGVRAEGTEVRRQEKLGAAALVQAFADLGLAAPAELTAKAPVERVRKPGKKAQAALASCLAELGVVLPT